MHEFLFRTKHDQTILLGVKARDAGELLEAIKTVPKSSIYHHTHRFLHQHHYLSPEPANDFAYWMTEVINDASLGEALSSVNAIQFHSIAELRNRLVELIDTHLSSNGEMNGCPRGEEFHFMSSQTFAFATPYVAHNLPEFMDYLQKVSVNSLYYHIFDARLRLEQEENDFSMWFRALGKHQLADEVLRLDPYTHTLEGLRKRILVMVRKHDKN
jgi:hypothetical protein